MIKNRLLTLLFSTTLFLSATLLFSAQPMIAKMLLPALGGTPAVWNTCMIFFQGILLAGYAYGHGITTIKQTRASRIIHSSFLLAAIALLPLDLSHPALASLDTGTDPVFPILLLLVRSIGFPVLILSATAPLLQHWFSSTTHPSARDPYFLYSASNTGSLVALLSYPAFIEPSLPLPQQAAFWSGGYVLLATLTCVCAAVKWFTPARPAPDIADLPPLEPEGESGPEANTTPNRLSRFRWTALACAPSSWMLGLTTYITTDIASAPLFWVVPLAIYLLTFILAFAKRCPIPIRTCERILPIGAVALVYLLFSQATQPVWLVIGIHLSVFFLGALACHGRLASERPHRRHLTEFYLWISIGGVAGGMINTLVAPILFTGIFEYPAAIIAACCLRRINAPGATPQGAKMRRPVFRHLATALPGAIAIIAATALAPETNLPFQLRVAIVFGAPLILVFLMVDIPWRFGLALACLVGASAWIPDGHGESLYAARNFYGVLRVTRDPTGPFRRLVHGSTLHGRQFLDPARSCEPLSYYHRSGPLHYVFKVALQTSGCTNVAVIGLGVGSTACYSLPHQRWTFYEINPAVISIALDTNYFTNLTGCMRADYDIVPGDARLRLRQAPPHRYELMILDAFSSDSIPVHLITREAIQLYLSKLANNGILAFHISNRSLNLQPVLGDLASSLGLVCYSFNETDLFEFQIAEGKDASHWLVMARRNEALGNLPRYDPWLGVPSRSQPEIWTDDFSNILGALNWW